MVLRLHIRIALQQKAAYFNVTLFSRQVQWRVPALFKLAVDTRRVGNEVQKHQCCVAASCSIDDAEFARDAGGGSNMKTRSENGEAVDAAAANRSDKPEIQPACAAVHR